MFGAYRRLLKTSGTLSRIIRWTRLLESWSTSLHVTRHILLPTPCTAASRTCSWTSFHNPSYSGPPRPMASLSTYPSPALPSSLGLVRGAGTAKEVEPMTEMWFGATEAVAEVVVGWGVELALDCSRKRGFGGRTLVTPEGSRLSLSLEVCGTR